MALSFHGAKGALLRSHLGTKPPPQSSFESGFLLVTGQMENLTQGF
jgi:hypothetical protein